MRADARGRLIRGLLLGLGAGALLFAGWAWTALYPRIPADLGGVTNLDAEARRVRIATAGADSIDGWYLAGRDPAVVLLLHGHGRDHRRMWRYGQFLHASGYGVLAIDFRSARAHHRAPTTLGHIELVDAQAALDWLLGQPDLRGHAVGLLGESLGGSVALLIAARNPGVGAVVDESGFASGEEAIADFFTRLARLPSWPPPLVRAFARAVTGVDPGALDVRPAAAALRDRPVLFIHGDRDARISPAQTVALWHAAGGDDPLWIVPGAGHNEGWMRERAAYEDTVTGFFDRHLLGRDAGR